MSASVSRGSPSLAAQQPPPAAVTVSRGGTGGTVH